MKVGPAPTQTQRSNGTSSTERQRKEIRQAQHNEQQEHQHNVKHANTVDICLLGIAIVIGGQFFSWNVSLAAGFWECLLGLILTGMGYLCLVLCMAEMNSALPFSGGSYGFVRVCIGPYFGYLVGCCEALQNIAYVTASVIPFGQMLTRALGTSVEYEPLWWAFFYITAIGINVMGGSVFWNFNRVIGLISLLFLLVYILGTAKFCDFNKFSESDVAAYDFNGTSFVAVYPVIAFFFIGVESLPLVCVDCENPQSQIPYGMISCYIILACTAIGTFFTVTSQFPGTSGAADELLPLNAGYERLFGISDMSATWFTIPTVYATGFGFMFIYGRQMSSMARSGLFPSIFKYKTKFSNTPFAALIGGSIASMILLLVIYYTDVTLLTPLFDTCIIASYFVYIAVFISYFIFRYRYQALPRSFRNPLGVWGGLIGICVFLIGIISALGFQDHDNEPFYFFLVYIAILIAYYYFYGFYDQRLSDEEQKILFRAYVVNANIMKKGKRSAVASNQSRGGRSRVSVQSRASNISGNSSNVNGKFDEALAEEEMDEEADESVLNESDISSVPGTVAASVFTKANSVIPPSPTHRSLHSHEHRTLRKHSINSLEPSPEEPEEISPDRQESVNYSTNVPRGSFHEPRRRQSNISNNSSEPVVDGKKRSFFRRSFESLTDRAREVIDNMKLLPLPEDQIRAEYEQILLQAMRRKAPTEAMTENENELPMERDENSPNPKEEV